MKLTYSKKKIAERDQKHKHTITYRKTNKPLKRGQSQMINIVDDNYTTKHISLQYSKEGQLSIHIKDVAKKSEWVELENTMTTKVDNPSYIPVIKMINGELKKAE